MIQSIMQIILKIKMEKYLVCISHNVYYVKSDTSHHYSNALALTIAMVSIDSLTVNAI
ncbi:hypothetical protein F970_00569, partial [Acinetobacter sp. CIP 102082]